MTLRPAELLAVAAEVSAVLPGRPLQKVVAAGEGGLRFGFAGGSGGAWLLVSVDRRFGRIHLEAGKPAGTGEAAAAFVMLLRKELVGLRFAGIEVVAGERAAGLEFARGQTSRRLLVFLYGNGPRLVLLDGDGAPIAARPPPGADGPPVPRTLPPPRPNERPSRFPDRGTSAAIARHYAELEQQAGVETSRSSAAATARRTVEKLRRKGEALAADLARLALAEARRHQADLLLAHLAEVPRGAAEVVLPDDFSDGHPVTIALDPARSASDNAARMYHEYRRLTRGRAAVEQRLLTTRAELARAEEVLARVLEAPPEVLGALSLRAAEAASAPRGVPQRGGATPRPRAPGRALPYRSFESGTHNPIFVGKGADKNDELTFRVARGNDLWLHARDVPGAHVVVPLAGRPVDETTLLDAATLALWFSPARPAEPLSDEAARQVQIDVTYALRKLVRKPRGAAPGRVLVAGGKTIRIRLEPERLRRLLASQTTAA